MLLCLVANTATELGLTDPQWITHDARCLCTLCVQFHVLYPPPSTPAVPYVC